MLSTHDAAVNLAYRIGRTASPVVPTHVVALIYKYTTLF